MYLRTLNNASVGLGSYSDGRLQSGTPSHTRVRADDEPDTRPTIGEEGSTLPPKGVQGAHSSRKPAAHRPDRRLPFRNMFSIRASTGDCRRCWSLPTRAGGRFLAENGPRSVAMPMRVSASKGARTGPCPAKAAPGLNLAPGRRGGYGTSFAALAYYPASQNDPRAASGSAFFGKHNR